MVIGYVTIPRLRWRAAIWFLADTGADGTCIHPRDGARLRLPFDLLDREVASHGVGGVARRYAESAIVSFRESGDGPIHRYRITLRIGTPEDVPIALPSLLGQDILRRWRMIHEPDIGRLEFHVKSSDEILR